MIYTSDISETKHTMNAVILHGIRMLSIPFAEPAGILARMKTIFHS